MLFDAIVVGAGSAGAVVATRLTDDPDRRVLLLEAGPDYPNPTDIPFDLFNQWWNSTRPHDWRFRAHHSQIGRPHLFPRGRVIGGSSSVNTAIALRGIPEDYDEWASFGNTEWSWEKLLPFFRDAARFLLPAHNACDEMYETAQVGKVAWGAALLAGASGDRATRQLAFRAAGALLAQQNPDGSWDNTSGYTREEVRDEVTAEFVSIMDEIEHGLAGVPLAEIPPPPSAAEILSPKRPASTHG